MDAAKWIRFAVLMAFAVLFGWLFYVRYFVTPSGDSVIGAFWIVPGAIFAVFALRTLRSRGS